MCLPVGLLPGSQLQRSQQSEMLNMIEEAEIELEIETEIEVEEKQTNLGSKT